MLADWFWQFGVRDLQAFLVATIIFAMTPGVDTMLVLNRTLGFGKAEGMMAALGVATGVFVHTLFAALGLAAFVAKSAQLFLIIKYLGAAYLLYLGVVAIYHAFKLKHQHLKTDQQKTAITSSPNVGLLSAYRMGLVGNVLNPKVALFFLAFFPQFISPAQADHAGGLLLLGAIYVLISAVWLLFLAVVSALMVSSMLNNHKVRSYLDLLSGVVFVLMGVKVTFSDR